MKVCFLIPDGVGIRNYLYSDILTHFSDEGHEVVVWHDLDQEVISEAESLHSIEIQSVPHIKQKESFMNRMYREAASLARLRLNYEMTGNATLMTNWNPKKSSVSKKAYYFLVERIAATATSYDKVFTLENRSMIHARNTDQFRKAREILKEMKPDVLFCTHQRPGFLVYEMEAARSLGIKTVMAIYSWDNLPKAKLPFRADEYLVWSDYMKEELLKFYPDIERDSVVITGTPQFDFYAKQDLIIPRKDFAEKYDLDPHKKWICFSGDDTITSPYDADYLSDAAEMLSKREDVQILFRRVPVENGERYKDVLEKYGSIKNIPPAWRQGKRWTYNYPLFEDVVLLLNLTFHCELVMNVGSTMAMDFANFDHPGLFLNYDQPHSRGWSVDTIYKFQHFRSMDGFEAVGWINSKEDILTKVEEVLSNPEQVGPDRKKWLTKIVQPNPEMSASQRIAQTILD